MFLSPSASLPILLGTGTLARVATGPSGLGTSINFYFKLSQDDMEQIANSLTSLQTQLTSLAAMTLQNR